jgi:hypothetical protein
MVEQLSDSVGGSMDASAFGINGGWGGIRDSSFLISSVKTLLV